MMGYNDADENGDADYERIVMQVNYNPIQTISHPNYYKESDQQTIINKRPLYTTNKCINKQADRARERQHWEGIKKAQHEKINDHEAFYAELDASADGYTTVASYFCKKPILS